MGKEILVSGQKELASYSASTGAQLWRVTGFAKLAKSSPIVDGDETPADQVESDLQVLNAKKIGHGSRL